MTRSVYQGLGRLAAAGALALAFAGAAPAGESPIGEPLEVHGIQLMGAYLQPVVMEPAVPGEEAATADIHMELDIHALADNANGFAEDAWIPYLTVAYTLARKGSRWTKSGVLVPMVANDGPHYGSNIKLDGPGAYGVTFTVSAPSANGFLRHTDKETGVAAWWQPIEHKAEFKFIGTGKKGGY